MIVLSSESVLLMAELLSTLDLNKQVIVFNNGLCCERLKQFSYVEEEFEVNGAWPSYVVGFKLLTDSGITELGIDSGKTFIKTTPATTVCSETGSIPNDASKYLF